MITYTKSFDVAGRNENGRAVHDPTSMADPFPCLKRDGRSGGVNCCRRVLSWTQPLPSFFRPRWPPPHLLFRRQRSHRREARRIAANQSPVPQPETSQLSAPRTRFGRVGRLKRFLAPQMPEMIVSRGHDRRSSSCSPKGAGTSIAIELQGIGIARRAATPLTLSPHR
jgi:hypothetical protein